MINLVKEFVGQFYSFYFSWGFYYGPGLNVMYKKIRMPNFNGLSQSYI